MLEGKDQFSDVEPRAVFAEPSLFLQMPEKLPTALVVGDKVQLLLRLERELEADEEWTFQTPLQDLALANRVRDFLLGHNLLLAEHLHGVDTPGVLLADLEHATESASANQLEELEIPGLQVRLGLRAVSEFAFQRVIVKDDSRAKQCRRLESTARR